MTNEKGTAIAIVLMVLAVVSLIGVALLTQSQLDVQLTSSMSSYDRLFGLADGGATVGFETIRQREDITETTGETGPPRQIYPRSKDIQTSTSHPDLEFTKVNTATDPPCNNDWEICYEDVSGVGGYASIIPALQDGECCPGYECSAGGGYKFESWRSDGRGVRKHAIGGTSSRVEVSVRICRKKGS